MLHRLLMNHFGQNQSTNKIYSNYFQNLFGKVACLNFLLYILAKLSNLLYYLFLRKYDMQIDP